LITTPVYTKGEAKTEKKATRRRGGSGKAKSAVTPADEAVVVEEAPAAEAVMRNSCC